MDGDRSQTTETRVGGTYNAYLVFRQMEPWGPFESEYSVLAPNPEMALILAQENFMRRQEVPANLMVVRQQDLHVLPQERRQALARTMPREYRMTAGYAHVAHRWRALKTELDERSGGGRR